MTGPYDDTEQRRDGHWTPSAPTDGHGGDAGGSPQLGPNSGSWPVQDPPTVRAYPVDPAQSGAHPVAGNHSGPYPIPGAPSSSGNHAGNHASGNPGVAGAQSGPYSVDGGHSGNHPGNQAGNHSGAYSVDPTPSGQYAVGGGHSGRYQAGGHSGPYQVDPAQGRHPFGGQPSFPPVDGRSSNTSQELSSQHLIKQLKRPPQSGWRRALYVVSGRTINLGESPADLQRRELIARINQPLRGCYKIAMLSLKGGVGKTTTTTTLGSTFSSLRGDRVIAVDANPDRGTLSQKIPLETTATVRHLLRDADRVRRYSDVRSYTSQGPSRLEVLASEQDPAVSEAFSDTDYLRTIDLLEHFYNIVLTDCGTGLMHSAMKGVLDQADSLVVVSSSSADGARSASATLDWLDAHGYRDLVGRSVAVINSVRPKSGKVDLDKLVSHFGARCRAVCQIPFDSHLEEGAEIELDRLQPGTRLALLELAAVVADDFPQASLRAK